MIGFHVHNSALMACLIHYLLVSRCNFNTIRFDQAAQVSRLVPWELIKASVIGALLLKIGLITK